MKISDIINEDLKKHNWDMGKATSALLGISLDEAKAVIDIIQRFHPDFHEIVTALDEDNSRVLMDMFREAFKISKHYDNSVTVEAVDIEDDLEEGMAWARQGNKLVRKYRCTGGPRSGRIVSKPGQCYAPPDLKKRAKLKQTKAKLGKRMARKRKKTMRTSAASKRVQALNK